MNTSSSTLVIIGGGPAGLAAAIAACSNGIEATILDKDTKCGGQFYSQFPDGFEIDASGLDRKHLDLYHAEGAGLIASLERFGSKINRITQATVWGIYPDRTIAYVKNGKTHQLRFEKLILAEGARERSVPFPGWTLPGITTAGCAQRLLKKFRVKPGNRVLLSGTGPIQLVLANQLISAGVEVVGVLESASTADHFRQLKARHIPSILRNRHQLGQGIAYLRRLKRRHVPYLPSHGIVSAAGENHVERAQYARLDNDGKPVPGTQKEVTVDAICLGHGFLSSTSLSHLAGVEHASDSGSGGLTPVHDEYMETSREGIFVAGDMAGVGGHLVAVEEGRIAGIRASLQLGAITPEEEKRQAKATLARLRTLRSFSEYLNAVYAIKPGLYARIADDTIICRCEEITAGELLSIRSIKEDINLNEVKKLTRAGMGQCQGRTCAETIAAVVALKSNTPIEEMGNFTFQEPPHPIRIEEFIQAD